MSNMAHHPALLSRLRITVAGQTREFADAVVALGRDTALPVVVVHPDVSRRHAELRRGGGGWFLVDLQSTNGTSSVGAGSATNASPRGSRSRSCSAAPTARRCWSRCCPRRPRRTSLRRTGPGPQHPPYHRAPGQQSAEPAGPPHQPRPADARHGTRLRPPATEPSPDPAVRRAGHGGCVRRPAGRHRQHARCRSRRRGTSRTATRCCPQDRPIGQVLTIGRTRANDVVLDDPLVSRQHATLELGQPAVLRDLNSFNGTFVNGHRVSGSVRLEPGRRGDLRKPDVHVGRPPDDVPGHPPRPDPVRGEPDHGGEGRQAAARRGVVQPRAVVA